MLRWTGTPWEVAGTCLFGGLALSASSQSRPEIPWWVAVPSIMLLVAAATVCFALAVATPAAAIAFGILLLAGAAMLFRLQFRKV